MNFNKLEKANIMATEKQFTVVGISKHPGHGYKVRFANDIMRIKNLTKGGHEDIRLAELDQAMDKMSAVNAIKVMDEFQDVVAQSTITEYIERNTPRAKPESAPAATKKAAPTKAKVKVAVTEDEEAPF